MTCDRLVCANCAGPVNEGRCPVCRASRQRMRQEGGLLVSVTPMALLSLLAILIAVTVLLQHAG